MARRSRLSTLAPVKGDPPHIGTLRETPLHASLKQWYAQAGGRMELQVDGYVIDVVHDDVLIEVQTSGFSSMKPKLTRLLDAGHRVRIVHPIPIDKWIVKLDGAGTELSRRKSPRHGAPTDIFAELVSFPSLFARSELELHVLLTIEEEHRRQTSHRSWRRGGWSIVQRRLVDVIDGLVLGDVADLVTLLPADLPERFTTAELARALGRTRRLAQQAAYCLRNLGAFEPVGKRGNAIEYRIR